MKWEKTYEIYPSAYYLEGAYHLSRLSDGTYKIELEPHCDHVEEHWSRTVGLNSVAAAILYGGLEGEGDLSMVREHDDYYRAFKSRLESARDAATSEGDQALIDVINTRIDELEDEKEWADGYA